jgi:glycosyltransferase involved in cell wall biosynthesis
LGNANIYLTLHDPVWHDERASFICKVLKARLYQHLGQLASSYDRFALHVHGSRLLHKSRLPPTTKIVVAGHPIPCKMAQRTRAEPAAGTGKVIRIGFMGRIEPYKGLEDFNAALHIAFAEFGISATAVEVVIAGRGEMDQMAWRRLPCNVTILNNFLSDLEFHQEMANLDLLVLPYRAGTQSGVAALAIAYKIPMVATRVGVIDELVAQGKNALLVPPGKPRELADALAKCVEGYKFDYCRRDAGEAHLQWKNEELHPTLLHELLRNDHECCTC